MAQDDSHGLTPLSLDDLDNVIGGAGGQAPGPVRGARKDDATHPAFEAAAAAVGVSVSHTEAGLNLAVHGTQMFLPHPQGGDVTHTLQSAMAHLDGVQIHGAEGAAHGAPAAAHPAELILTKPWTLGH